MMSFFHFLTPLASLSPLCASQRYTRHSVLLGVTHRDTPLDSSNCLRLTESKVVAVGSSSFERQGTVCSSWRMRTTSLRSSAGMITGMIAVLEYTRETKKRERKKERERKKTCRTETCPSLRTHLYLRTTQCYSANIIHIF